jgi:hypothetical protein
VINHLLPHHKGCHTPLLKFSVPTTERLIMSGITFEQWLALVNTTVEEEVGLSISDLPDCPYRDWFDGAMGSRTAAARAINNVIPGFLVEQD